MSFGWELGIELGPLLGACDGIDDGVSLGLELGVELGLSLGVWDGESGQAAQKGPFGEAERSGSVCMEQLVSKNISVTTRFELVILVPH